MKYEVLLGDCIKSMQSLPAKSVNMCVTSPPYFGLRDYGNDEQIGQEKTPEEFVAKMVEVFTEVHRVLRDDGTLWLNLGDSYAGSGKGSNPDGTPHPATLTGKQGTNTGTVTGLNKPQKARDIGLKAKDLIGIPWRVAFALQADGWYLRQDIIWHKPNPMPESVRDRCTKSHEYIFLLSKKPKYYYDHEAVKEDASGRSSGSKNLDRAAITCDPNFRTRGGFAKVGDVVWDKRNRRSVWTVSTKPYKGAHFATFPPDLIEPCILAGCPENGMVLDPFGGSGTTAGVANANNRNAILCELNPEYAALIPDRVAQVINDQPIAPKSDIFKNIFED